MKNIIIFSNNKGWHEQSLCQALKKYNARVTILSLSECRIGFNSGRIGLDIPGFSDTLPDAVFVRAVPGGGFEEVSFRLDILHALTDLGILVYNDARIIEQTVDKGMTSFLLARSDIASPPAWVCESESDALAVVEKETAAGRKLVLKPLFGNCGRGLQLIESATQLPAPEQINGVYYLQSYVAQQNQSGRDWRVLVINGQAVAAMERISEHWITNRARGGKCLPAVLTEQLRNLAEDATRATGAYYAGVDIIADAENQFMVLEVNSVPAWRGLQSVCKDNIAQLLVDDFMQQLNISQQESAVG